MVYGETYSRIIVFSMELGVKKSDNTLVCDCKFVANKRTTIINNVFFMNNYLTKV